MLTGDDFCNSAIPVLWFEMEPSQRVPKPVKRNSFQDAFDLPVFLVIGGHVARFFFTKLSFFFLLLWR
jgi:hypothetical protein